MQILAALLQQRPRGCYIDVDLTANARAMLVMPLATAIVDRKPSSVDEGGYPLSGVIPCYRVYETQDGWYSVGALEAKFWARFVRAIGLGAEVIEGQFDADYIREIARIMRSKTTAAWEKILGPIDCMTEPVLAPMDPRAVATAPLVRVQVAGETPQTLDLPSTPLAASFASPVTTAAPLLGQHNDKYLARSKL